MLDRRPLALLGLIAIPTMLFAARGLESALQDIEGEGWPKQIDVSEGRIIIYQPQPDVFEGNMLSARAAVSVTMTGQTEPVFGTAWFSTRVQTDRDNRTVEILDIAVPRVRFPNATPEQEERLKSILETELPKWEMVISLDRLLMGLEQAELERKSAENLNNDPPKIIFSNEAAILVLIDGEPRLRDVEDSDLQRIINTPFTILFSPGSSTYYLYADDDTWYTTTDIEGEWQLTSNVPSAVAQLAPPPPEEDPEAEPDTVEAEPGPPPSIVVATEPTELIVFSGEPEFTPITGTELLYVSNSESDVLMDIASQRYFVILSGRWFASTFLDGPWSFVLGDELPADFSQIPPESEMGHLRVSVPGTDEANEAVMDNQIPQTSAISRSETKLDVTYDGDPQFEPIEGTDMEYAVNTNYQVIRVGREYYACHQAVWFVADSPTGPWTVADEIPDEIYTIPPESPVYNVKYVQVYESTPEVVYVGYYPGYAGSYVYHGTMVYGTGWYYPGWYGGVYYARPATWGFHMRWNPWYGWSFGLSYSTGPFTFRIGFGGWYRGGWWGPVGYRGYRHGYHRGWHHGYRAGARAGYRAGYRAGQRQNIYNRPQNRARNVARTQPYTRQRANVAPNRANNVYSDRSGNVHRRTDNGGWQQRGSSGWSSDRTPNTANRSQLDRSAQSRQRGTTRTNNFNSSAGRARSGGRSGRRR
jgi:hypothetical protein